jgi:hypothetical protein
MDLPLGEAGQERTARNGWRYLILPDALADVKLRG